METIERIKTRRTIRKFKDEKVPREVVEQIVSAAAYAPSWKNSQTTRYVVIEDKEVMEKIIKDGLMGLEHNSEIIRNTPVLVVVTSIKNRSGYERDGSYTTSRKDKWEAFDAGIATQTFVLAASELGVGSVIMGIYDEEKIKEILELPEDRAVSALVSIGYPDENPVAPKRKEVEELIEYR